MMNSEEENDSELKSWMGDERCCENPKGASTPSKDPISFVCAYRRGVVFSTLERQQQKGLSTVFIDFNSNLIQGIRPACLAIGPTLDLSARRMRDLEEDFGRSLLGGAKKIAANGEASRVATLLVV
ncbi:hypothetical protein LguiA_021737 [Lonicera macranthoides]